jgi:opacity protein-like surface antigen
MRASTRQRAGVPGPGRASRLVRAVPGAAALLLLTAVYAASAAAQTPAPVSRWSLELRAGTAIGDYEPASSGGDHATAFSWGASVGYAAWPRISLLAGYSRTGFGCEKGFCQGRNVGYTGAGADLGVEAHLWAHRSTPWLRVSGLLHRLHTSWDAQEDPASVSASSDAAAGLELAAGWLWHAYGRFALNPGLRFGTYRARFPDAEAGRVNHMALELGLRMSL